MNTFNGKSVKVFHNSDYSGDCLIINKETNEEMNILTDDLIDFVAEYVKKQKIKDIEYMTSMEILRLE